MTTQQAPKITLRSNAWIAIPVVAIIIAVAANSLLFINYIHVFTAILWTGTDIFIGFILSPILKSVSPSTRKEITSWLVPKTLFYLPALSSVTITAGYFMASKLGYLTFAPPIGNYMIAVVIMVAILVVQGFGILLPTNFKIYLELQKSEPDHARIQKLMSRFARVVVSQSLAQFITIFIMANLATGLPPIF
ncbi:MAG: hypothetical protein ACYC7D_04045 [Nitrososphaerales archaeon]